MLCGKKRKKQNIEGDNKFETKKYWLEKSKLYGKQAILRWLQKENIDTTPNSWQERYHL